MSSPSKTSHLHATKQNQPTKLRRPSHHHTRDEAERDAASHTAGLPPKHKYQPHPPHHKNIPVELQSPHVLQQKLKTRYQKYRYLVHLPQHTNPPTTSDGSVFTRLATHKQCKHFLEELENATPHCEHHQHAAPSPDFFARLATPKPVPPPPQPIQLQPKDHPPPSKDAIERLSKPRVVYPVHQYEEDGIPKECSEWKPMSHKLVMSEKQLQRMLLISRPKNWRELEEKKREEDEAEKLAADAATQSSAPVSVPTSAPAGESGGGIAEAVQPIEAVISTDAPEESNNAMELDQGQPPVGEVTEPALPQEFIPEPTPTETTNEQAEAIAANLTPTEELDAQKEQSAPSSKKPTAPPSKRTSLANLAQKISQSLQNLGTPKKRASTIKVDADAPSNEATDPNSAHRVEEAVSQPSEDTPSVEQTGEATNISALPDLTASQELLLSLDPSQATDEQKEAAVKLQATIRGFQARKKLKGESIEKLHEGAPAGDVTECAPEASDLPADIEAELAAGAVENSNKSEVIAGEVPSNEPMTEPKGAEAVGEPLAEAIPPAEDASAHEDSPAAEATETTEESDNSVPVEAPGEPTEVPAKVPAEVAAVAAEAPVEQTTEPVGEPITESVPPTESEPQETPLTSKEEATPTLTASQELLLNLDPSQATDEQKEAATKLQATFRGFQARKKLKGESLEKLNEVSGSKAQMATSETTAEVQQKEKDAHKATESSGNDEVPLGVIRKQLSQTIDQIGTEQTEIEQSIETTDSVPA
ncbi:UNVERIFIED_CONTAM: hypothetical protein HDU68_005029 [Siphonaria sp. JEL0065]|nr:hypothetical protein HDU68_005029 [Siphonaria sp. JEL0065]